MATSKQMRRSNHLTMFAPWFGPLPDYGCVFLDCCEASPSIEWVVHSDQPPPRKLPPWVQWHRGTGSAKEAAYSLGVQPPSVDFQLRHKLCDLKPWWPELYPSSKEVGRWGWIDWDCEHRLEHAPLAQGDTVLFTPGWLSSPCVIFNTQPARQYPPYWQRYLTSKASTGWEERVYLRSLGGVVFVAQQGLTPRVDVPVGATLPWVTHARFR